MNRHRLEILLTAALLALLGHVAALGGAIFWAASREGSTAAGLSSVLYAPFALLALMVPALAAPAARRALALRGLGVASAHPWPSLWRFAAVLGIAEGLTMAARLAGGASPLLPLLLHGLLGAHAAFAAIVLGRSIDHANQSTHAGI